MTVGMATVPVSICILTYNAEAELNDCLRSVAKWAEAIFIVDSNSTDRTTAIASKYTDRIFAHAFEGFAQQRNWALDSLPWATEWVMFVDQDERLTQELRDEIAQLFDGGMQGPPDGFYVKRRFLFMGRWLRHGGYYPNPEIRLFRREKARVVDAGLREYLTLKGTTGALRSDMLHESEKCLGWWIAKHNKYADVEAEERLTGAGARRLAAASDGHLEGPRQRLRRRAWDRLPMLIRPFLLFTYRYVIRLGFLDGGEGFIYCVLHDLWYPFLVDAKVRERKLTVGE